MTINMYKADLIGLSTEAKPSNQIDGTTFYCVDTSEFYIYYKGTWYKQGATEEVSNSNVSDSNSRKLTEEKDVEIIIEEPIENEVKEDEK